MTKNKKIISIDNFVFHKISTIAWLVVLDYYIDFFVEFFEFFICLSIFYLFEVPFLIALLKNQKKIFLRWESQKHIMLGVVDK